MRKHSHSMKCSPNETEVHILTKAQRVVPGLTDSATKKSMVLAEYLCLDKFNDKLERMVRCGLDWIGSTMSNAMHTNTGSCPPSPLSFAKTSQLPFFSFYFVFVWNLNSSISILFVLKNFMKNGGKRFWNNFFEHSSNWIIKQAPQLSCILYTMDRTPPEWHSGLFDCCDSKGICAFSLHCLIHIHISRCTSHPITWILDL